MNLRWSIIGLCLLGLIAGLVFVWAQPPGAEVILAENYPYLSAAPAQIRIADTWINADRITVSEWGLVLVVQGDRHYLYHLSTNPVRW